MAVEHEFGWGPKTMPRPNEADLKRLAGMVKRGELHPVLNHTKWAELRTEMLAAPVEEHPRFRARSVFAPPDFCTKWDGEFYYHVHPVADLEWMEHRGTQLDELKSLVYRENWFFCRIQGRRRIGKTDLLKHLATLDGDLMARLLYMQVPDSGAAALTHQICYPS